MVDEETIDYYMSYEQGKIDQRYATAMEEKKSPPIIPYTIGITNVGSSCAFNSVMQIIHLMPNHKKILKPIIQGKFSLVNMAHAVIEMLDRKYKTINMQSILKQISSLLPPKQKDLKTMISNINHSVISHITECLDITKISFMRGGDIRYYIAIDPDNPIEQSFQCIKPFSFNQYVFAYTIHHKVDFLFPQQILVEDDDCTSILILKGFITNPQNHFIAYIRLGFTEKILCVNDQSVHYCSFKSIKHSRLALYYVYKMNKQ